MQTRNKEAADSDLFFDVLILKGMLPKGAAFFIAPLEEQMHLYYN